MKVKYEDLSKLAMWESWQKIVKRSLPGFAESPIFVQQDSQTDEDFEKAAEYVAGLKHQLLPDAKTRDEAFGGRVRETKAMGKVTRMWIDSNVEADFLARNVPKLKTRNVIDIGAGYGRLASFMVPTAGEKLVSSYSCVDAVPISTDVCTFYCKQFAKRAAVLPLRKFLSMCESFDGPSPWDLAINVHSWNECTYDQVDKWTDLLVEIRCKYLFTVSNGSRKGGRQAYSSWGGKGESFLSLLEGKYNLVVEEHIGLSEHPHALWKLK